MTLKILSFGAGVNSTAILTLVLTGKYDVDVIIFADTYGEHPSTYDYLHNVIQPACIENGLQFIRVSKSSLYQDYWDRQIIPFRRFRHCTDKYKIRPIKKYINEFFSRDNTTIILGIDYGEQHRADKYQGIFEFPLIDLEIDREGCKDLIKNYGWSVPIKSGCFFCPFTKKNAWIHLLKTNRELYLRAEALEKNCRVYPKYTLFRVPLEKLRRMIDEQQNLTQWMDFDEGVCMDPCVFCHR